jgi:peptidyl-prolyl cis-trans isomerase B (cyclophilin B)
MNDAAVLVFSLLAAAAVPSPAPSPSAEPNEAVVETAQGSFVIRLLPELAPSHVKHFIKTARAGGYDGTTFHRIVTRGIIQGGDPLSKDPKQAARYGTGGLGILKAEFSPDRAFIRGTVAAARKPSGKDTGGSQFFVVVTDQPSLKGQYTIFGEVVSGMEVVDTISDTPVDGDKPRARVEMKVSLRSAEPAPPSPVAP